MDDILATSAEDQTKQLSSRLCLAGRVALVTGGHRGLGASISVALAVAGADVVVIDRRGPSDSQVPSAVRALSRKVWSIQADLADDESIHRAVQQAFSLIAPRSIDILVNNAGVAHIRPLESLTVGEWDNTMAVNLRAPFLLSQLVLKGLCLGEHQDGGQGMLARGRGVIVNISSLAGHSALVGHAAYSPSKAALDMLTKCITLEFGGRGIRCNGVAPTVVLTEMGIANWSEPTKRDAMLSQIPSNRFAEPHEVADAVVFLASDASSMINGQTILLDGGYSVR